MDDVGLEEILDWLKEGGVELQHSSLGSVLLRDVVAALVIKVMALEKGLAEKETDDANIRTD